MMIFKDLLVVMAFSKAIHLLQEDYRMRLKALVWLSNSGVALLVRGDGKSGRAACTVGGKTVACSMAARSTNGGASFGREEQHRGLFGANNQVTPEPQRLPLEVAVQHHS